MISHLDHQSHADLSMEFDVAMEEPVARIVGLKTDNGIASIGHSDGIFDWRIDKISLEQPKLIQLLDLDQRKRNE